MTHVRIMKMSGSSLRRDTSEYWFLSSIWHKRISTKRHETMGQLLAELRELITGTLHHKIASRTQVLLAKVIQNKRCRKSKPTNNVVPLYKAPKAQLVFIGLSSVGVGEAKGITGLSADTIVVDDLTGLTHEVISKYK